MSVITIPPVLEEKLGADGAQALVDLLNASHVNFKTDVVEICEERFESRLSREASSLRSETSALSANLQGEMVSLRSEFREEMANLAAELRGEMANLGSELRGEMAGMRSEYRDGITKLHSFPAPRGNG